MMQEEKSELEKTLITGFYGAPQLKPEERKQYLGEFRERIIKLLTKKQVMEQVIYSEILEALKDKRAVKLIINGEIDSCFTDKYEKMAEDLQKPCTILHDPDLKGETGLIVVSNDAVDIEDIQVENRETKLKKLGIPPELIHAAGKKICKNCFDKIVKADPNEAKNYQLITLKDRFWGEQCCVCHKD